MARYIDRTGERYGRLVAVRMGGRDSHGYVMWECECDCGDTALIRSACLSSGNTKSCGCLRAELSAERRRAARAKVVGYSAAHRRVWSDRGPARDHACVACGGPATEWAYNHSDPNELKEASRAGRAVFYSLDPEYYNPRCAGCHVAFDKQVVRLRQGRLVGN